MSTKSVIPVFAALLFLMTGLPAGALPDVYDADDDAGFIGIGRSVLSIDYMEVWENGVITSGGDYPYGRIWIILYDPRPYENRDLVQEAQWKRSDEIDRFEIPGPSSRGRWSNEDKNVECRSRKRSSI